MLRSLASVRRRLTLGLGTGVVCADTAAKDNDLVFEPGVGAQNSSPLTKIPSKCTIPNKKGIRQSTNVLDVVTREDGRIFFEEAVLKSCQRTVSGKVAERTASGKAAELPDYFLKVEHLVAMAEELKCTDYSKELLQRVYNAIPKNPFGHVTLNEFQEACAGGQAAATLNNLVRKYRLGFNFGFQTPVDYDYNKSTNENYKTSSLTFVGEFSDIRKDRDYSYHVNYTEARQAWQDAAIKSTISRTARQPAPWMVYTCGPMGVGKGFALDWMSKKGFFPLENIVHVDPDAFKLVMPEWSSYVAEAAENAGSLCHMESSFMMEVAQEAAMNLRQNIWIDGSLRNADFYAGQFEDIKARFPHYSIAIFYVTAPEAIIRERIAHRAEATGRDVPEHLIVASLGAMDRSLNTLTPLSDFVARIDNQGSMPLLKAFETVNKSGCWEVVRERFARITADTSEFPNALAPFALTEIEKDSGVKLTRVKGNPSRLAFTLEQHSTSSFQAKLQSLLPSNVELVVSPASIINMPVQDRKLAKIPMEATESFWIYPFVEREISRAQLTPQELEHTAVHLLRRGAFGYASASGDLLQINVVAGSDVRSQGYLQFGHQQSLPLEVLSGLSTERFQPTPRRFREASSFAWFPPCETAGDINVGGPCGAFVFQVDLDGQRQLIQFPVMGR